jgi:hypothetical protein
MLKSRGQQGGQDNVKAQRRRKSREGDILEFLNRREDSING